MKPTNELKAEMLDNKAEFTGPFFERFTLRRAPEPLKLNDELERNYYFPTFYGDVTCAIAIFMCDYDKAHKMMLHPKIKPVRMTRGRSLVVFSCYEYKRVLGVPPYNEIAMTIPVMVDPGINVPVLPMVSTSFSRFGYYVFSMPVTSLENQIRGTRIWGLPKVVEQIAIEEQDGDCVATATTESGERYLTLRVPMQGKPAHFDETSRLYTRKGDTLLQSETSFNATFNVTKYMGQLFKKGNKPDREYITIGDGPTARILNELDIEEHPFQFRYARSMSSCFDLPNPDYKAPFSFES